MCTSYPLGRRRARAWLSWPARVDGRDGPELKCRPRLFGRRRALWIMRVGYHVAMLRKLEADRGFTRKSSSTPRISSRMSCIRRAARSRPLVRADDAHVVHIRPADLFPGVTDRRRPSSAAVASPGYQVATVLCLSPFGRHVRRRRASRRRRTSGLQQRVWKVADRAPLQPVIDARRWRRGCARCCVRSRPTECPPTVVRGGLPLERHGRCKST